MYDISYKTIQNDLNIIHFLTIKIITMKKLKPLLAYLLAYIIILIGFVSMYYYMKSNVTVLSILFVLTTVVVFYPAISYWSNFTKKLLNIKNEE